MRIGLKKKKLLALDWDQRNLRLVLVRPRGDGFDLVKAVSIPIPREVDRASAESFGAFVREGMRQARISTKQAVMSISRDQVVLNTLSLPPTPANDLASIVQFQTVKELPFSADQATLDFVVGHEFDPKSPSTVLVAAVRHEELTYYKEVAREAGLSVQRIGLRPYANRVAITKGAPDTLQKTLLVVEIGPQLTEIDIIRDGAIAFSRAASVALPEFGDQEGDTSQDSRISSLPVHDRESDDVSRKAVNDLMVDIVHSFEAYRAMDTTVSVDQIVVCGASGIEAELAESLAARFAARAELYSPEHLLELTPRRAMELRGFSAVLGLAFGHSGDEFTCFDFLHPTKPISKATQRAKKVPAIAAAVLLFVAAGGMFHYRFIKPKLAQVEALQARVDMKKTQEDPITAFKMKVDAIEGWAQSEQVWPEVLVSLTRIFPEEQVACVTRAHFETKPVKKSNKRESSVNLKLKTASLGIVDEISNKLREHGFEDVRSGKDTLSGQGNARYNYDTSVSAVIPIQKRNPIEPAEPVEPVELDNGAAVGLDEIPDAEWNEPAKPAKPGKPEHESATDVETPVKGGQPTEKGADAGAAVEEPKAPSGKTNSKPKPTATPKQTPKPTLVARPPQKPEPAAGEKSDAKPPRRSGRSPSTARPNRSPSRGTGGPDRSRGTPRRPGPRHPLPKKGGEK